MVNHSPSHRQVEAEAAAWIARLQATPRDSATEAALKAWLNGDAARRDAFERATELWAMIPGAAAFEDGDAARQPSPPNAWRAPFASLRVLALAASLLLVLGSVAWWLMDRPVTYTTERGEQEVATLDDG